MAVRELLSDNTRFSGIQDPPTAISSSTLVTRLQELQPFGLLKKEVSSMKPAVTDYVLTDRGLKLEPALAAMAEFGLEIGRAKSPDSSQIYRGIDGPGYPPGGTKLRVTPSFWGL